jgi:hypothetical protein
VRWECKEGFHLRAILLHVLSLLHRTYFVDAGWEDRVPKQQLAGEESGTSRGGGVSTQYRRPPHTYSVRPYEQPAGDDHQPRT